MNKIDLQKYVTGRCQHRHKYCEHPQCFIKERQLAPKIGYLDIESSGLYPFFGCILTYSIKTRDKDEILGRMITKKELQSKDMDKQICKDLIQDIAKYDEVVTYYGSKFDIPFIRTVALSHNLDEFMPVFGQVRHTDVYYLVKFKLRLQRRSLDAVTKLLGIGGKTFVDGTLWKKASLQGDMQAMQEIYDHNKADVEVLEEVHKRLEVYCGPRKVSM